MVFDGKLFSLLKNSFNRYLHFFRPDDISSVRTNGDRPVPILYILPINTFYWCTFPIVVLILNFTLYVHLAHKSIHIPQVLSTFVVTKCES